MVLAQHDRLGRALGAVETNGLIIPCEIYSDADTTEPNLFLFLRPIDNAEAGPYTLLASRGKAAIGAQPGIGGFSRRDARSTHLRLGFLRVSANAV